ncbi:hypothetical protein WJX81_003350 [Elliptochloris bilobata]|uniref:Uncharacterized protein n=1 Tax=Elliptochloris bilobata TaxID=381761 RepID=A0AAW1RKA2_9CHLO
MPAAAENVTPRCTPTMACEHARYITEVAATPHPQRLDVLLRVLVAQGLQLTSPAERAGLHPLVVPLASGQAAGNGTTEVMGLLRWPEGSAARGLPVVSMAPGAPAVTLCARSTDEYVHRALAEEDERGGPGPLAAAAGEDGGALYEAGAVRSADLRARGLGAYLTRSGALFPDVAEALCRAHQERGDSLSALITAEWYMRGSHFPGWARPREYNAQLLAGIGRDEEARDSARMALRLPWWTLAGGFAAMAALAQLGSGAGDVQAALARQAASQGNLPPGMVAARDARQQELHEAAALLDLVSAGEGTWDAVRSPLAERYRRAGLAELAGFVSA